MPKTTSGCFECLWVCSVLFYFVLAAPALPLRRGQASTHLRGAHSQSVSLGGSADGCGDGADITITCRARSAPTHPPRGFPRQIYVFDERGMVGGRRTPRSVPQECLSLLHPGQEQCVQCSFYRTYLPALYPGSKSIPKGERKNVTYWGIRRKGLNKTSFNLVLLP